TEKPSLSSRRTLPADGALRSNLRCDHPTGYPKQGKSLRPQPLTSQGIERKHESRTGQITCHPQNHHHTRLWRHPMHQTRGTRFEKPCSCIDVFLTICPISC